MAEKRSLVKQIFSKVTQIFGGNGRRGYEACRLLNSWQTRFTPFSGDAYSQAQVRTAVHTFAKRAACAQVRHIKRDVQKDTVDDVPGSPVPHLLNVRANPTATAYKLLYRAATHYKLYNNAFLYPVYEYNEFTKREELKAIYNINASSIELVEYQNEVFCVFEFLTSGERYIVPYVDVIHVAAHVNQNDIFGESNKPIQGTLKVSHSLKQSVEKYAELIQVIRGILVVKTAIKDEDLKDARDRFIKNNLSMDVEGGGIIVSDNKFEYRPLDRKSTPIPTAQLEFVKNEVFEYFGVNGKIVRSEATGDEETAYYNGEILPFYTQLSQSLTSCLCRSDHTEIVCAGAPLKYMSPEKKLTVAKGMYDIGALMVDEVRDVFGFSPYGGEEGKRRFQSLNFVDAQKAEEYQIGKKKEGAAEPPQKEE